MTTRMKRAVAALLAAAIPLTLPLSGASADVGSSMDSFLNDVGGAANVNGPTAFQGQSAGYYSLGNVWTRWGGDKDPDSARETLRAWMAAQPSGIEGRRQMPQFNLTDDEYRELADFLLWTNTIRAQDWPPNDAG